MVQIGDKYRVVPAFIEKVEYLGGDVVGQVEQSGACKATELTEQIPQDATARAGKRT